MIVVFAYCQAGRGFAVSSDLLNNSTKTVFERKKVNMHSSNAV